MKAKSLEDVVGVFNPRAPLQGSELREFYLDRPGNPLSQMQTYLRTIGRGGKDVKLLFSGHRGCGKSTELNKLCAAI